MKKFIIITFLLSILLSSCSIDWNDEKDKKITELEKQIQDDTFKKKQDCAKYIADEEKSILNDVNSIYSDSFEIFYNKPRNSCLKYLIRDFHTFKTIRIDDLMTNENIFICKTNENTNCENNSINKIKELKGE